VLEIYALLPSNPYGYGESTHEIDVRGGEDSHHLMMNLSRRVDTSYNEDQDARKILLSILLLNYGNFSILFTV
jgi:hypothetical protein